MYVLTVCSETWVTKYNISLILFSVLRYCMSLQYAQKLVKIKTFGFVKLYKPTGVILWAGWDAIQSQVIPPASHLYPFIFLGLGRERERHCESYIYCPRTQHNDSSQHSNLDHSLCRPMHLNHKATTSSLCFIYNFGHLTASFLGVFKCCISPTCRRVRMGIFLSIFVELVSFMKPNKASMLGFTPIEQCNCKFKCFN